MIVRLCVRTPRCSTVNGCVRCSPPSPRRSVGSWLRELLNRRCMPRAAQLLVDEPFDDEPEVPPEALTRRRTTPRRRAVARVAELLDESPIPPFFPILHKLYSRILASLQVAMDHLAEPETALQDLTTLHDQVHTRLQPPPHSTASSTTRCTQCRQVPRRSLRRWMSSGRSSRR